MQAQDVEQAADGKPTLRHGVAWGRRISLEVPEMRHGPKSCRQRIDGYKRHVLRDLDSGLVRAVGMTSANAPEISVTAAITADLAPLSVTLVELHIDRGYLSSPLVRERPARQAVYCKAWPVRNRDRFPKAAFALDGEAGTIRCPNEVTIPFKLGSVIHFPAKVCAACPSRARCTSGAQGRSVAIPHDERLLRELRERQQSPEGRAKLRHRLAVAHALPHVGRWQGRRARYRGVRKNLFDLRRPAVVHNLHVIARVPVCTEDKAA